MYYLDFLYFCSFQQCVLTLCIGLEVMYVKQSVYKNNWSYNCVRLHRTCIQFGSTNFRKDGAHPVEISGNWCHFGRIWTRNTIWKQGQISCRPDPDIRYIPHWNCRLPVCVSRQLLLWSVWRQVSWWRCHCST